MVNIKNAGNETSSGLYIAQRLVSTRPSFSFQLWRCDEDMMTYGVITQYESLAGCLERRPAPSEVSSCGLLSPLTCSPLGRWCFAVSWVSAPRWDYPWAWSFRPSRGRCLRRRTNVIIRPLLCKIQKSSNAPNYRERVNQWDWRIPRPSINPGQYYSLTWISVVPPKFLL